MLASHKWLMELSGLSLSPERVAERLTSAGLEVEGMTRFGAGLDRVVVAEVRSIRAHPERDKLRLVTVFDGEGEQEVVCGAANVPDPGGRVVLAQLGAKLPGDFEITERKLGGVVSRGMLCAETELGIGADDDGILVLGDEITAAPGTPITRALDLDDVVYEIGLTPNRPDCLGHVGIARDLCVLEGKAFAMPDPVAPERGFDVPDALFPQAGDRFPLAGARETVSVEGFSPVRVDVRDDERCPRYGAALVGDVTIKPSPFAARYRLHVLGQRAINNVVDATNLILLGFGHPIHAFDYDRVRGSRIEVRLATAGEQMTTLDGEARELTEDDLLICDGQGPVALAGVMGGENSEIHDGTRRVLIECAYFAPRSVRRTSKRTGLHTDSSHRFERGVDPNDVRVVLAHAAAMIANDAGGAVGNIGLDVHPRPSAPAKVALRLARVEALLGLPIARAEAHATLTGLGCVLTDTDAGFDVEVPSHRPDLGREVDLIEELARIAGYDRIATEVPTVKPSSEGTPAEVRFVRALRESAAAAGLNEAVNYAFVAPSELALSRLPEAAVQLANPMSEERSVLRTGLLPGLARNLGLAQRHQVTRFAQFEVARIFAPDPEAGSPGLPKEHYQLGILLWGQRGLWYEEAAQLDFYDLKGFVQATLRPLLGVGIETELEPEIAQRAPFLHPRRAARVCAARGVMGYAGELHPEVVDGLGLSGRPVYAVLEVPALLQATRAEGAPQARPLQRFPASVRDIAVVVDETVPAGDVAAALQAAGGELVEAVRLFDIYRGKPVAEGHKSLAYHVVYRNPETTLTDKIVDKAHAKIIKSAEQKFGGSLRK